MAGENFVYRQLYFGKNLPDNHYEQLPLLISNTMER